MERVVCGMISALFRFWRLARQRAVHGRHCSPWSVLPLAVETRVALRISGENNVLDTKTSYQPVTTPAEDETPKTRLL